MTVRDVVVVFRHAVAYVVVAGYVVEFFFGGGRYFDVAFVVVADVVVADVVVADVVAASASAA